MEAEDQTVTLEHVRVIHEQLDEIWQRIEDIEATVANQRKQTIARMDRLEWATDRLDGLVSSMQFALDRQWRDITRLEERTR